MLGVTVYDELAVGIGSFPGRECAEEACSAEAVVYFEPAPPAGGHGHYLCALHFAAMVEWVAEFNAARSRVVEGASTAWPEI